MAIANNIFFFLIIIGCSIIVEKGIASESVDESTQFHNVHLSSLIPSSTSANCHQHSTHEKGGKRGASSLKVSHRYGSCSPTAGGKSPTLSEILAQDESRVNSINARVKLNKQQQQLNDKKKKIPRDSKANVPAKSGSTLGTGNYVVTVGLGTPKKSLTLVFDTGSDLTWTQCQPCARSCYQQQEPIFDPKLSTTYSNISCSSPTCSGLSSATGNSPLCSGSSTCIYGIQYGDQSFSVGYFAKDRLSLTPTDVFDTFLFGCGQNNQGLFGNTAGLLGLGRDPLSFVSQAAQKFGKSFSYCLPTKGGSNGHLSFGASKTAVKYTPFADSQGTSFYFIDIQSILVGRKQLPISPVVFRTAGGTIIDSGTVITRLPPAAYSALRDAFKQGMSKYPTAPGVSILDTCYDLSKYTTISIPKITFVFKGNAVVDLPFTGILFGISVSQVCLAFAGNGDATDVGIYGNIQQQTMEVVYDVAKGQLGFGAAGCT